MSLRCPKSFKHGYRCLATEPSQRPNIDELYGIVKERQDIVEHFKLMSKMEEGLLPVSGVEPQFTDFHLAEEKQPIAAKNVPESRSTERKQLQSPLVGESTR